MPVKTLENSCNHRKFLGTPPGSSTNMHKQRPKQPGNILKANLFSVVSLPETLPLLLASYLDFKLLIESRFSPRRAWIICGYHAYDFRRRPKPACYNNLWGHHQLADAVWMFLGGCFAYVHLNNAEDPKLLSQPLPWRFESAPRRTLALNSKCLQSRWS